VSQKLVCLTNDFLFIDAVFSWSLCLPAYRDESIEMDIWPGYSTDRARTQIPVLSTFYNDFVVRNFCIASDLPDADLMGP
jgi:hypothetical protein